MNAFDQVSALFRSKNLSAAVANLLDQAYAEGCGKPDWHHDFGLEKPEMVAMNLAGIYAADTAANVLAAFLGDVVGGKTTEEGYLAALKALVDNDLSRVERLIVKNLANLAWRAGQPFRDMATNPLGHIEREVNMQFNLLPLDEEDKDLVQLRRGAQLLLTHIKGEPL